MRALRLLAIAATLSGCGATGSVAARPATEARIRELESRLARRSEEVRELRGAQSEQGEQRAGAVVRIGEPRCEAEVEIAPVEPEPIAEAPAPETDGSRPILRLYGEAPRPAASAAVAALPGPVAPSVVPPPPVPAGFERLPVTSDAVPAIPEQPLAIAPPRVAPEDDPIVREYQAALAEVEARRWEQAFEALDRFARAHPDHPYADNAVYWQGEVLYARREYRRALAVLEALVSRYPDGNKVPDALLRIGYCLQRLGDPDRARATFRRVREQYPDSVAARMASREET